ncbi:LysR family transcriptional regulator [Vibrio amylolyticus]|uniref:LysR family transcriptional regulator n=1 Tax=Vibrio amylolyticus TaxID=2847292 RepID=UPI003551771A
MNLFSPFKTFVIVAQHLNFSAAARQLDLPRATVSARVRELEKQLGVRLFQRNNRNVSLTEEGQHYLEACQQALSAFEDADAALSLGEKLQGEIRLALPVTLPNQHFLEALTTFQKKYPDITIEMLLSDQVLDLAANRVDIAIRGKSPVSTDLVARELDATDMILVATKSWMSLNLPIENWNDLVLHDPLAMCPFSCVKPNIKTVEMSQSLALCLLGTGAALLPRSICESQLKDGSLQELECDTELPRLSKYLIYQQPKYLPQRVKVLIDFLLHELRS